MVAELRRIGNRWVLYTNEAPIYKRFSRLPSKIRKVPYVQKGKLVGIDFYFDRKLRKRTIQIVKSGQLLLDI